MCVLWAGQERLGMVGAEGRISGFTGIIKAGLIENLTVDGQALKTTSGQT